MEKRYQHGFEKAWVRNWRCTRSSIQLVIFLKTAKPNDATEKFIICNAILKESISMLIEKERFQPTVAEIDGIIRKKLAKL